MSAVVTIVCDRCGAAADLKGACRANGGPQAMRETLRLKGWTFGFRKVPGQRQSAADSYDHCPACRASSG